MVAGGPLEGEIRRKIIQVEIYDKADGVTGLRDLKKKVVLQQYLHNAWRDIPEVEEVIKIDE